MAHDQKINIDHVVRYLNHAFAKAMSKATGKIGNKALRTEKKGKVTTTTLYDYQVKFCYLIDDIQRGPIYIAPKKIQEANELIAKLEDEA